MFSSVQFSSASQSCPTLCDPKDHSTPDLPVHHQLPESTQTHVDWVGDAIQPSHPLLSASPSASIFPSIRVFSNELALCIRWPSIWVSASTCSECCNVPPKFPFTNKWFFSLMAGNASGLLWKLPWPGESFLTQNPYILSGVACIQWVLNAKKPMDFSAEWVILKGINMSLLCGQLKPGFSVYPILYPFLPIHRLRSWVCLNELHAC